MTALDVALVFVAWGLLLAIIWHMDRRLTRAETRLSHVAGLLNHVANQHVSHIQSHSAASDPPPSCVHVRAHH